MDCNISRFDKTFMIDEEHAQILDQILLKVGTSIEISVTLGVLEKYLEDLGLYINRRPYQCRGRRMYRYRIDKSSYARMDELAELLEKNKDMQTKDQIAVIFGKKDL